MKVLSNKQAALLGLLWEGPKHPYEIEKEIEGRSMREWTEISMSSVYKLLTALEKDDFLTVQLNQTKQNRTQKVYTLTEEGNSALARWVKSKISKFEIPKWPMDIAISNLRILDNDSILTGLRSYKSSLIETIEGYYNLIDYLKSVNCPKHRFGLAKRPIRIMEGELIWVNEFMEELENE